MLYTIYGTQYEFMLLDTVQGSKTGCDALTLPFPIADDKDVKNIMEGRTRSGHARLYIGCC